MKLKDNCTMIISSCDAFSDLWNPHVILLEKYWGNREMKTFILTDKETNQSYEKVAIFSAGKDKEWSERLGEILKTVDTEFVFITLDDYFLVKPVLNNEIENLLDLMKKENWDYMRLFLYPKYKRKDKLPQYKKIYQIDTTRKYSVNLYTGIWKKSFLEQTIREPKTAWDYEVSLSSIAHEIGANCVMSNNDEFVILDVVRKGKILHKAYRYLRKHNLYHGNRPIMPLLAEMKLYIRTKLVNVLPKKLIKKVKSYMVKRGYHYYSKD